MKHQQRMQDPKYREKRRQQSAVNSQKARAYREQLVASQLNQQGGKCAICGCSLTVKLACRDHCHRTGKYRGLLCHPCNAGIGLFREQPEFFKAAIRYLRAWGA